MGNVVVRGQIGGGVGHVQRQRRGAAVLASGLMVQVDVDGSEGRGACKRQPCSGVGRARKVARGHHAYAQRPTPTLLLLLWYLYAASAASDCDCDCDRPRHWECECECGCECGCAPKHKGWASPRGSRLVTTTGLLMLMVLAIGGSPVLAVVVVVVVVVVCVCVSSGRLSTPPACTQPCRACRSSAGRRGRRLLVVPVRSRQC